MLKHSEKVLELGELLHGDGLGIGDLTRLGIDVPRVSRKSKSGGDPSSLAERFSRGCPPGAAEDWAGAPTEVNQYGNPVAQPDYESSL